MGASQPKAAKKLRRRLREVADLDLIFGRALEALDRYGNLATNYQGPVSFTTSDSDPGAAYSPGYFAGSPFQRA
jgi:hypothetical protein